MGNSVHDMLSLKNWAVVGATSDASKFGYKVMKKLINHGYNVFPVNPNYEEIEGIKCYKNITEISDKIDVIDLIVNPRYGIKTVEEAIEKGINNIWCQPGAESEEIIKKAKKNGINILPRQCVLQELD